MHKLLLPLAAAATLAASAVPASAQYWGGGPSVSFGISSGPSYYGYGPRYYDHGPRYHHRHHHRGYYAYGGSGRGCIVTVRRFRADGSVVIRRINRC
jgi:hypothetical protein